MVTELRNRHAAGVVSAGINVRQGVVADMWAEKVVQPLLVNTSEISLATECVGMILKIGKILFHHFYCRLHINMKLSRMSSLWPCMDQ